MAPHRTNRMSKDSGPYVLRKVSRHSPPRMRRATADQGLHVSRYKIFDSRGPETRRGRMIVSKASVSTTPTKAIPKRAAAICMAAHTLTATAKIHQLTPKVAYLTSRGYEHRMLVG